MLGYSLRPIQYAYATGRIRVLETRLIGRTRINRLAEAADIDEMQRVLAETEYGPHLRQARAIDDIETALDRQLEATYRVLEESNIPAEMADYFRSRHDFMNLRVLIKSGFGQQIDVPLSALGRVPAATVEELIKGRTFAALPDVVETAAREAVAAFEKTRDFERIDIVLDRRLFHELLRLAGRLRSKWVTGYTRISIDIANGRVAARGRQKGIQPQWLLERMLDGGNISRESWGEVLRKPEETGILAPALPDGGRRRRLSAWISRGMPLDEYDLIADNLALEYLETAKPVTVGPEPVFAYVAAREQEIKMVRMVITARLSGLLEDQIRKRLDLIYG